MDNAILVVGEWDKDTHPVQDADGIAMAVNDCEGVIRTSALPIRVGDSLYAVLDLEDDTHSVTLMLKSEWLRREAEDPNYTATHQFWEVKGIHDHELV